MKLSSICWAITPLLLVLAAGCPPTAPKGVEVVVEGNQAFPSDLVGTWANKDQGWQFNFADDGSIQWVRIGMGRVMLKPGEKTTVPMINGGKGEYEPGLWTVHYDPDSRILTVDVVLEHLKIQVAPNLIEGRSKDTFVGQVSRDGMAWNAVWTSFPRYVVSTDEYKDIVLGPDDPKYGMEQQLLLEKVVSDANSAD